ncbi:hypothetical protein LJ656_12605 [Paraburkholderia sp. MMS20-SJTR3]|uniref:Uncharacterized protein n=1 Tax=Paraburkholderia sejongensis TaxID=2886946 RepID=A0ABS8JUP9_9BURK|nr:hypothetical protein [Paraburkholderia sp. MMS20-SJTR3]MCC8393433.1 hypothetical protein [Paraburkholderia sp. MMS20-SJTR3]
MEKNLPSFHDWFLTSVSVNVSAQTATVSLCSDDGRNVARLSFQGAPRLLFEGFAAQNIVSELRIIEVDSDGYAAALALLEAAHPWGDAWPKRRIAHFGASLGADSYIEFDRATLTEKAG